jgi:hypothetical protein
MKKAFFIFFFINVCLAGFSFADEPRFKSFDEELDYLFAKPELTPNDGNGLSYQEIYRIYPLENQSLAFLFLSALQEKYAVLEATVSGKFLKDDRREFLNDPCGFFTDWQQAPFSWSEWMHAFYSIVGPTAGSDHKELVLKLRTIQDLEGLRMKFAAALRAKGAGADTEDELQRLKEEITAVIQSVPGNSGRARREYLRTFVSAFIEKDSYSELKTDVLFMTRLITQLEERTQWIDYVRARLFFQNIARAFSNAHQRPLNTPYVFWAKAVPGLMNDTITLVQHPSFNPEPRVDSAHFDERALFEPFSRLEFRRTEFNPFDPETPHWQNLKLRFDETINWRFYISDGDAFRELALSLELPIALVSWWQALQDNPNRHEATQDRSEALFIMNELCRQLQKSLTSLQFKRLTHTVALLTNLAKREGIVPAQNLHQLTPIAQGRGSVKLSDGQVMDSSSGWWLAAGIANMDVTVTQALYESEDLKVEASRINEKRREEMISSRILTIGKDWLGRKKWQEQMSSLMPVVDVNFGSRDDDWTPIETNVYRARVYIRHFGQVAAISGLGFPMKPELEMLYIAAFEAKKKQGEVQLERQRREDEGSRRLFEEILKRSKR